MIRFAILNGLRPELRGFVIQKQPENFDQLVEAARLAELSSSPLRGADTSAVLMDQIADMRTQLKEASAKWDKLLSAPVDAQSTPGPSPNSATNWTQSSRLGPRGGRPTFTPRSGYPPQRPQYGPRNVGTPDLRGRSPGFPSFTDQPPMGRCSRCARPAHANINLCPAVNKTCYYCQRKGHLSVCCRTALRTRFHAQQQSQQQFPRPSGQFNPY